MLRQTPIIQCSPSNWATVTLYRHKDVKIYPGTIKSDKSYDFVAIFTLRAKLSDAVYCDPSCLFVGLCVWVCYHDNSKLCASIFIKLGL